MKNKIKAKQKGHTPLPKAHCSGYAETTKNSMYIEKH